MALHRTGAGSRPRSGGRAILIGAVLLGIGIAASAGLLISHLRERALSAATRDLERVALVLSHQADRTLQAMELVQTALLQRLGGVLTADRFRDAVDGMDFHRELNARIRGLPQADALNVLGADGTLLNSSRWWPVPEVNIRDRDYYQALAADQELRSFLSIPVRNRSTGGWTFYLARKVPGPEGELAGLILGALDLGHFERLYQAVDLGPGSSVTLYRQDGVLLARHPRQEDAIGQRFGVGDLLQDMLSARESTRQWRRISSFDGVEKLTAAHFLNDYPVAVLASVTTEQALEEWRIQASWLAAAAALLELVLAATGLLVLRHLSGQRLLSEAKAELAVAREREAAQAQARLKDARFRAALENMSHGLCMFDAAHRLVVINPRCEAMFSLPPGAVPAGTPFTEVVDLALVRDLSSLGEAEEVKARTLAHVAAGRRVAFIRDLADGRSLAVSITPLAEGGWIWTFDDVTERRQTEARIAHMAHHDGLTGLPNRVLFRTRLEEALAASRRGGHCAVLCLDLDHFKAVNDTLGHPIGDALLRAVTDRLRQNVREVDTVARLGGDEFAIIQTGADLPADATALAERLIATLGAPYELDGHTVTVGASIGIALLPGDGADADAVLKHADLALYRAKAHGRATHRFFEPGMDATLQARRLLELDLRNAVAGQQFELFYQPIMDLRSGALTGFEALIRWRHPTRGLLSPDLFIPISEETGLIKPIGDWVLQRACADAMQWPGALQVSVNLSPAQFSGPGPLPSVRAALAASGLHPSRLELEITETVVLADADATLDTLRGLKAIGVSIAMDDFGTGYSSLGYLKKFPFDRVKIDKSFIADAGHSVESAAIIETVTVLCRRLGMATTVEGVETEAQMQVLRRGCCTSVQGYLFSKPRPADEVLALCGELRAAA